MGRQSLGQGSGRRPQAAASGRRGKAGCGWLPWRRPRAAQRTLGDGAELVNRRLDQQRGPPNFEAASVRRPRCFGAIHGSCMHALLP